jgi:hypothetical protein
MYKETKDVWIAFKNQEKLERFVSNLVFARKNLERLSINYSMHLSGWLVIMKIGKINY